MRLTLLCFFLLAAINMQAQSYKKYIDEDTKDVIYKGKVTFELLQQEKEFGWYKKTFNAYNPQKDFVNTLAQTLKKYEIIVFMGTWCDDSHELIPKLDKLLLATNYPIDKVKMYGLDLSKQGLQNEEAGYNIEYVPTIVLTYKDKEIGRIVETVEESLEVDMARIIVSHGQDKID